MGVCADESAAALRAGGVCAGSITVQYLPSRTIPALALRGQERWLIRVRAGRIVRRSADLAILLTSAAYILTLRFFDMSDT